MDLCAAPGGWLQVAQKYMPMSSTIVGVDLAPIRPIRGVTTLVEDITTQSCRAALKRVTPQGLKYDVVIHDGAPNVGGNFAKESYTQAALTLDSLRLATEFLGPGGWFVTKVFRSVEYHALLYAFQQLFKKVESTKPVASRGTSAEIYVVCSGYLAPTKIDPRLLDARHLFADTEAEIQPLDVTKDNGKRKRNRSGYEDGASTLYKECTAEEFIVNEKPGEMLGSHHTFILDGKVRRGESDVFSRRDRKLMKIQLHSLFEGRSEPLLKQTYSTMPFTHLRLSLARAFVTFSRRPLTTTTTTTTTDRLTFSGRRIEKVWNRPRKDGWISTITRRRRMKFVR